MEYTTDELIEIIKLRAAIPAQQPAYSNANLLRYINTEYKNRMYPILTNLNNEYFVTYSDTTITSATQTVAIPENAIGIKIREIKIIDGEEYINVPRLEIDTLHDEEFGFYLRGNNIYLQNFDDYIDMSLRVWYYERPSDLVLTTSAAKVATVGASTYTVVSVPSAFGSGLAVDYIKATPHFDDILLNDVCTIASVTVTPTTFSSNVSVGDYICEAGDSCIVQLPAEMFDLLAQAVVVQIMESQSDMQGLQVAQGRYERMEKNVIDMLSERVKGENRKIVNKNSFMTGNRLF